MFKGLKLILAGMVLAAFSNVGRCAANLSVYDGVNPLISVTDNGPGDEDSAAGSILVITNVGVWNLTLDSAVTKPVFGSTTDPVMSMSLQANSTAAGSLRFTFSDNGFGPASGTLNTIGDGHIVSGAAASLTYDVYGDPANVVGATTVHIASDGTIPLPGSATGSGVLSLPAPFSLTQVAQLDVFGAADLSANVSFSVAPVPEPGIFGFAVLSFAAFAFTKLQRKRTILG
jgi:hypothetical protein